LTRRKTPRKGGPRQRNVLTVAGQNQSAPAAAAVEYALFRQMAEIYR
jgi:hypothetical protein